MGKVSIIVPVYNSEKYLEKCLDSLVNQTLRDIEIIVVDDGSTDSSPKIISDYEKSHPDKIHSIHQPNGGQASARNNGVKFANGEYIAFVDSDDYVEQDAYEKAYGCASEGNFDIVCFRYDIHENGSKRKANIVLPASDPKIRYILNEASPWNKLIRRSLWEENKLRFTENRIYEDLELIPQLALYTKNIFFMEDALYHYVIHEGSTMRQTKYNEKLASIYPVMETLKEKFSAPEYHEELEFLYILHMLYLAGTRYLRYKEGKNDIRKISNIMKTTFPHWRNNKYYQQKNFKYKIICTLIYKKQSFLLKKLLKI
jgi:glycosyltransferase involved in cell wall biosynthesis